METYVIFRRGGWGAQDELQQAAERSTAEEDRMSEGVRWIRSYILAETDGSLGTVCVFQASDEAAIRTHAYRAGLPADEVIPVADTVIVRPDPESTDASAHTDERGRGVS
jgi:hypothetical protein